MFLGRHHPDNGEIAAALPVSVSYHRPIFLAVPARDPVPLNWLRPNCADGDDRREKMS
jgi:hypothetical protein